MRDKGQGQPWPEPGPALDRTGPHIWGPGPGPAKSGEGRPGPTCGQSRMNSPRYLVRWWMQAFYETLNVTPIFNCIYIHSECRSESIPNHYKLMLDVSIMFIQNADQYPCHVEFRDRYSPSFSVCFRPFSFILHPFPSILCYSPVTLFHTLSSFGIMTHFFSIFTSNIIWVIGYDSVITHLRMLIHSLLICLFIFL